jgi:hypothetical protein
MTECFNVKLLIFSLKPVVTQEGAMGPCPPPAEKQEKNLKSVIPRFFGNTHIKTISCMCGGICTKWFQPKRRLPLHKNYTHYCPNICVFWSVESSTFLVFRVDFFHNCVTGPTTWLTNNQKEVRRHSTTPPQRQNPQDGSLTHYWYLQSLLFLSDPILDKYRHAYIIVLRWVLP